ncbi:MAG: hypothetical protein GY694_12520 [Gammaproteobacteria bacterium]|nr:hypothetical protein [Gammaproteobacteria bacterium]
MENTTLLNIKSSSSRSTDVITGQALAMVASDQNKSTGFKSALKHQMDSNKDESQLVKKDDLPQNGKDLPKKEVAAKEDDEHKLDKANYSEKTKSQNLEESSEQSQVVEDDQHHKIVDKSSKENEQFHENETVQNDSLADKQEKISQAFTNSDTQDHVIQQQLTPVQTQNAQAKNSEQYQQSESPLTEIIQLEVSDELTGQVVSTEESEALNNVLSNPEALNNTLSNPESLTQEQLNAGMIIERPHLDKKLQNAPLKGSFDLPQSASNTSSIPQAVAASANASGFESDFNSKNESSLTKSIAEFQQFIEMSKKNSMSSDPIVSVKLFEQSLKNGQSSTQILSSDLKLPSGQALGQNALSNQVAMQIAAVDKANSNFNNNLNNNPMSFLKTAASLEVKTAVGKPGWNQNFSNQVIMMANNGVQQAKIKLNPMRLGPVEAMVKLSSEGAVVNLTSLHLTTKEALESAIPRLKEMLNENGFSQVDVNVSHQDKKQQHEAALNRGSNNEHGNSTMPGDEQLSEESLESNDDTKVTDEDEQGLKIVDYYA